MAANRFFFDARNQSYVTSGTGKAYVNSVLQIILPMALILGLALILVIVTRFVLSDFLQLAQSSATTVGVVTDKYLEENEDEDAPDYYLSYTYRLDGITYEGQDSVNEKTYGEAEVGGQIDILYSPNDPRIARAGTSSFGVTMIATFVNLLALAAVAIIPLTIWRLHQRNQLLRDGELIEGQIVDRKIIDDDGIYKAKVTYRYASPATGQPITKSTRTRKYATRGKPQKGDSVAVLYLSDGNQWVL